MALSACACFVQQPSRNDGLSMCLVQALVRRFLPPIAMTRVSSCHRFPVHSIQPRRIRFLPVYQPSSACVVFARPSTHKTPTCSYVAIAAMLRAFVMALALHSSRHCTKHHHAPRQTRDCVKKKKSQHTFIRPPPIVYILLNLQSHNGTSK